MKYNTITKQVAETVPGGLYENIDYHGEPPADVAARAGWVDVTPEIQLLIDAAKAEQDAANVAAEAEYMAGVDVLPRPVRGAFESLAPDGHVYGLEIDAEGEAVFPVQRESTRLTQAEYDAAKAARLAARATHRDRITAIKTDLDQVEAALDQVDATTTGPMGLAITATTGATKTALQEVRKVIADMKTATKNLKQASEKLRREVR